MESLEDWKKVLRDKSSENRVCVLVEGKRDFVKLSSFNIQNIYTLKGKRFYDVVEEIIDNCDVCIILFDLDKHGEKMTLKFSQLLSSEGVEIDTSFREFLRNFNIEEIENIP
ncbi:MAG: toprim domain-containing protein [Hydrogenothermaceae bacterium]